MRTLKFRGKNTLSGKWVYGTGIQRYTKGNVYITNESPFGYDVVPETVGQFTGLFDKNGKEVYEGDIIEWTETHYHAIGAIAWREQIGIKDTEAAYNVGWCVEEYKGKVTYIIAPSAIPYGVVVGNVHDNYELLKGG